MTYTRLLYSRQSGPAGEGSPRCFNESITQQTCAAAGGSARRNEGNYRAHVLLLLYLFPFRNYPWCESGPNTDGVLSCTQLQAGKVGSSPLKYRLKQKQGSNICKTYTQSESLYASASKVTDIRATDDHASKAKAWVRLTMVYYKTTE